jgi:hypothetical protein
MYCACFSSMTSQPASTTITVMKAVEQDEGHGNAVHAEEVLHVEAGIQGACSTNCMPASFGSKPV